MKLRLEMAGEDAPAYSETEGKADSGLRPMTEKELEVEGWDDSRGSSSVIVLDDGTKLYPSQDDEGNGPGAMFGVGRNGKSFRLA